MVRHEKAMESGAVEFYGGHDPRDLPAYTFHELALSLRMAESTIRAWTIGQSGFEKLLSIPRDPRGIYELSFYNLIEVYVLVQLRRTHGMSMPQVRRCIQVLSETLETEHPIVQAEFVMLGSRLYAQQQHGARAMNLSRPEGQLLFAEAVKDLLTRVDKGPFGDILRFYPKLPNRNGVVSERYKPIVVDPEVSFGRPRLAGTGIPTDVIASRRRGGDSIRFIAEDMHISVNKVRQALDFETAQLTAA
jgi:uncharacterized protein (DUF433 family)